MEDRKADLTPPLGYPGGPCHVVERIVDHVRDERLRHHLVDEVEHGGELSNPEASRVYDVEVERGDGIFKKILISRHAQYRMDLRGITVPEVRATLRLLSKLLLDWKSQKNPRWADFEQIMQRRGKYEFLDPKVGLFIVFSPNGADTIELITTYRKGEHVDVVHPGECGVTTAARVAARWLEARFKPPRKGFPDTETLRVMQDWTSLIDEKLGHDLGDWRTRWKSTDQYGWRSKCVKCGADFEVHREKVNYGLAYNDNPPLTLYSQGILPKELFTEGLCNPKPQELIRGILIDMTAGDIEALLQKSGSEVATKLVKIATSRPLGASWTHPDNRKIPESYAEGGHRGARGRAGVPTILHCELWLQDQRRNYKPAGFVTLEGFEHEEERYLGNSEVVRLIAVEWWDGAKWVKESLPSIKAKT